MLHNYTNTLQNKYTVFKMRTLNFTILKLIDATNRHSKADMRLPIDGLRIARHFHIQRSKIAVFAHCILTVDPSERVCISY